MADTFKAKLITRDTKEDYRIEGEKSFPYLFAVKTREIFNANGEIEEQYEFMVRGLSQPEFTFMAKEIPILEYLLERAKLECETDA